jgi:hypothetical protein
MKKLPFLLGILLCSMGLFAQQSLLVFLEASEKKPFYVKIGSKINVSSSNGQVYITELNGSNFDIFIGFPQTDLPELRFQINLKKSDNSFQLKQANQGWNLIDLDNDKVIQPAPNVVNASMPIAGVRKTDAFSIMMAGVVNDTSVLYTSVISTPPVVNEPLAVAADPAQKTAIASPDVPVSDQAANPQSASDKKNHEKLRTSALIDSTKVKHVDSSLALQKSQAAEKATADSLSKAAEKTTDISATQNDTSSGQSKSEVVAGKDPASTQQSEPGKKESGDKEALLKDSLDKIALKDAAMKDAAAKDAAAKDAAVKDAAVKDAAVKDAAAKDAAAKDAAAKDAAAKDGAVKDAAVKDAAAKDAAAKDAALKVAVAKEAADKEAADKDAAAKDLLTREAVTKDSIAKINAANDASARANHERDSLARASALKDSLSRETIARENAAKEATEKENAAKQAADKENAAKAAIAKEAAAKEATDKEAATKEALDKENATKDALARDKAVKDSVYKASLKNKTPAGNTSLSEVKKISEKKTEKTLTVSYTDKSNTGKTDTIQIIIPIDPATSSVPKKDSIFPKWQSNPRPLTDPVASKKDSQSTSNVGMAQPVSKGPVMVNSDCVNFATEYDLDKLRVKMIAEVSADDRIAAAKKVFRTKCFTCRQIRALTELFLNDEGKYKFLDTAYPFASDSQEFRNLVSVLKEDYYVKRFNAMIRM